MHQTPFGMNTMFPIDRRESFALQPNATHDVGSNWTFLSMDDLIAFQKKTEIELEEGVVKKQ